MQNKLHNYSRDDGSGSLATMFTVFSLISFVLLFSNVSQYVTTRAAVQKAADRAARCVASVEGGCVTEEVSSAVQPSAWFGSPSTEEISVYAQSGDYSLNITHTAYSGTVQRNQVRSELHRLQWSEWQLPVTRVYGLLNSWFLLEARVKVNIKPNSGGDDVLCELKDKVEIPFGLDFNTPSTYFDPIWCGATRQEAFDRAFDGTNCSGLTKADFSLSDVADWGTYCSIVLPGVSFVSGQPVFSNEQPWLLLGGEAICDTQVSYDPGLSKAPIEASAGSASAGEQNRPFPMTVERQYVVIDIVSCRSSKDIASKLESLFGFGQDAVGLADFLGASREISSSGFTPYEFKQLTADTGNPDDTYSLFLYSDDPSSSLVALPSQYDWTFLRWERQVERFDASGSALAVGDPKAERTVLRRKICGWYTDEQAQVQALSGISNARAMPEPIRIVVNDGSCQQVQETQPPPSYLCENRFFAPPGGDISQCQGWESRKIEIEKDYALELERLNNINNSLAGLKSLSPAVIDSNIVFEAAWGSEAEDIVWQTAVVVGDAVDESYRLEAAPIELSLATVNKASGEAREPSIANWLELLRSAGVDNDLGWSEFVNNPQIATRKGEEFLEKFENLSPNKFEADFGAIPIFTALNDGEGEFDFDLDCQTEKVCNDSSPTGDLKDSLWALAAEQYVARNTGTALPNMSDSEYEIIEGSRDFYRELGTYQRSELPKLLSQLPKCAALQSSCRMVEDKSTALEFAGYGTRPPERCRNNELINCFATTELETIENLATDKKVDIELAKGVALSEFSQIFPGSTLKDSCQGGRCLEVEVVEQEDKVEVETSFAMPLTFPLNAILNQPYVFVRANSSEPIEVKIAE